MSEERDPRAGSLREPFDPKEIKFKPQMVKNNRALAMPYIDARLIQDRLDEVMGVADWQDRYSFLPDGSVVCRLSLFLGGRWVTKTDVGSPSEQPDSGDRVKAAVSDALKRAAVKFGIGRYLYRLPAQWCDYDPVKKQLTQLPQLPAWALPSGRAGVPPKPAPPPSNAKPAPAPAVTVAQFDALAARKGKVWWQVLADIDRAKGTDYSEAATPFEQVSPEYIASYFRWLEKQPDVASTRGPNPEADPEVDRADAMAEVTHALDDMGCSWEAAVRIADVAREFGWDGRRNPFPQSGRLDTPGLWKLANVLAAHHAAHTRKVGGS